MLLGVDSDQLEKFFLMGGVDCDTFLDEMTEVSVPFLVGLRVSLRLIVDEFDQSTGEHVTELRDQTRVLIVLTRDVQGQVLTINNTLDEAQVVGEQLTALLLDQHLARVKMDVLGFLNEALLFTVSRGNV